MVRKKDLDERPWLEMSKEDFKVFQKKYWEDIDRDWPVGERVTLTEKIFGYSGSGKIAHCPFKDRSTGKLSVIREVHLDSGNILSLTKELTAKLKKEEKKP